MMDFRLDLEKLLVYIIIKVPQAMLRSNTFFSLCCSLKPEKGDENAGWFRSKWAFWEESFSGLL